MIKTPASEIKGRFATVHKKHMDRWAHENPPAKKPPAAQVLREMKAGKFSVNVERLGAVLEDERGWDHFAFEDVITTPSLEKYARSIKAHEEEKTRFEESLQEAKDAYLDRVLFDHESGFLLLRDFQKWRDSARAAGVRSGEDENPRTNLERPAPSDDSKTENR